MRCWDVTGKSGQRQFNERGNTAGPSRILKKGVRLWVFAQQQAPTADRATQRGGIALHTSNTRRTPRNNALDVFSSAHQLKPTPRNAALRRLDNFHAGISPAASAGDDVRHIGDAVDQQDSATERQETGSRRGSLPLLVANR